MPQHLLLSVKAKTSSLPQVARMTPKEAHASLTADRFADKRAEPYRTKCGCLGVNAYRCRPVWKCKACDRRFSLTSGTILESRSGTQFAMVMGASARQPVSGKWKGYWQRRNEATGNPANDNA